MQRGAERVGLRGLGRALGGVWEGAWARSVEDEVGLGQGLSCDSPDNTGCRQLKSSVQAPVGHLASLLLGG